MRNMDKTPNPQKSPENDPVQRQVLIDFLSVGRSLLSGAHVRDHSFFNTYEIVSGDVTDQIQVRGSTDEYDDKRALLEILVRRGVAELPAQLSIYRIADQFSPVEKEVAEVQKVHSYGDIDFFRAKEKFLKVPLTNTELVGFTKFLKTFKTDSGGAL